MTPLPSAQSTMGTEWMGDLPVPLAGVPGFQGRFVHPNGAVWKPVA